ncbi:CRISPR-associated RAMP protein, Cmr4 family [Desulfofarcimen acetoxidans DSM 771]|uniref:CRISPR-associated RAMP protein, Cmr4 family n=1 Tax=Desulfofarcimen acetoxidans (strain ATCC 49208 / DSM 771 / KCTC 5769 / VKM B-1644 / 5575) TaxID=485916 RepID=C8W3E5_DESAS|nr:type III-B CRISPR module RAMP protein Cmr4 [Desulfofarcimen acetoxidans]ACV63731.1 CRISPR-associated RAMP protein, Cmr4 family [Desulfofarcimen acetoxidans DSM 771]
MKSAIIGLLAETSLHPGTEQSTGVVDMPVARESFSGYPVIVGSSMKGALRDMAHRRKLVDEDEIFGKPDKAGAVAVTDARLLLLPVRSMTGHYKWVTCPYILERLQRDRILAGMGGSLEIPRPDKEQAFSSGEENSIFLEELSFKAVKGELTKMVDVIKPLIPHKSVQERLNDQLVIINDDNFAYFAAYGLQVNARNQLNEITKTSMNLWYEETLPPDSLFYFLLISHSDKDNSLDKVKQLFNECPYLQIGGNETVGQGWCAVAWPEKQGGNK